MSSLNQPASTPVGGGPRFRVSFAGTLVLDTCKIPTSSLVDLSETGDHPVYLCCWTNGENGKSTHVSFPRGGSGTFSFDLDCCQGDFDTLKMQATMRMRDQETGNLRSVPLCMSFADMNKMLRGEEDSFRMQHPFVAGVFGDVTIRIANAADFRNHPASATVTAKPLLSLCVSNVHRVADLNQKLAGVSTGLQDSIKQNNANVPRGVESMLDGLSSREFGGRFDINTGAAICPQLLTQYAIMNAQEECLDRQIPVGVAVYHMYLKLVHSGLTAQQVLALDDEPFGQFVGQAFQITCDAGLVPYEKDFIPGLALSFTEGFTLAAMASEDIGLPLCKFQMDGRNMRKVGKINVTKTMSMEQLKALFKQPPPPAGSVTSLNPEISVLPREPDLCGALPDLYLGLLFDDCESSAWFARLVKKASLLMFQQLNQGCSTQRAENLKRLCQGWNVFKCFTGSSWHLMTRIFDRANTMLSSGSLKIMTGVGLATNASAAEEEADTAQYCGHCFNVGVLQTPMMPKPSSFLLEGTAPMYQIKVTATSPRVTVHLFEDQSGTKPPVVKDLNMAEFLSLLSGEILALTQVINKPNGMVERKGGWPMDMDVRGWITKTMVMSSLDSDPDTHLSFYHRIVYMGLSCADGGLGCMPMKEDASGVSVGCHPYDLANVQLRGLGANLPPETVGLMTDIMNEISPPMAPAELVQTLANNWIPCLALEQVNVEGVREQGVSYHRVVAMESPCAPEYLSIIHEAKRRLVEETNRLNRAQPGSDGIILTAMLEGLSSLVCADVPDRNIATLTIVKNIRQALLNIKWNGYSAPAPLKNEANYGCEHPWKTVRTSHAPSSKIRFTRRTRQ